MAVDVCSESSLARTLLADVEQIVERTVARMQELLPSYARVSRADLVNVVSADTRRLLEAVEDPAADRGRAEIDHRTARITAAHQGVTSDDLLQRWQIGLEIIREEAQVRANELGVSDRGLLGFVEATLSWGDVATRALMSAHRAVEVGQLSRLAEEQAALRQVATLVAHESPPEAVLAKVAEELGLLLRVATVVIHRFDADGLGTVVGTWGKAVDAFPVGRRTRLDGDSATASAYQTQRPVRVESYAHASGAIAEEAIRLGFRSAVACPLFVSGHHPT
jgi:GAF domain